MVEFLRRHAAILAIVILAWLGYGDLNPDTGKKKAEAKTLKLEILPEHLRVRGPDETLPPIVDPYRLAEDAARDEAARAAAAAGRPGKKKPSATTSGTTPADGGPQAQATSAAPAAPADPADMAMAWLATVRTLGRDLLAAVRNDPPALAAGAAPAPGATSPQGSAAQGLQPPKPVSFALHLESTLAMAEGGQARISGQTVQVGASLQGMDPEKPPRLLSVRGTEAVVAHGNDVYVLDLVSRPVVTVGNPALAVAEATPVQAGGAPSTGRPRGTRGPTSAGPAAPKAPAASQPSGGTKKGGYKVRKLPTKKKP